MTLKPIRDTTTPVLLPPEPDDFIIGRHFHRSRLVRVLVFLEIASITEEAEVVEEEGDTLGHQGGAGGHDLHVQVGAGGIAGVADFAQQRPALHLLMKADADAVVPEVREQYIAVGCDIGG